MFGNATITGIIAIIIIIVIGVIIYNNYRKKDGFVILSEPKTEQIYRDSVYTLIDKILISVGKFIPVNPDEADTLRVNLFDKAMEIAENPDVVDTLGASLSKWTADELSAMNKEVPDVLIATLATDVEPWAKEYLTYREQRWKFPLLEINPEGRIDQRPPHLIDSPADPRGPPGANYTKSSGNAVVKPVRINKANMLTEEINRDHKGVKRTAYMNVNSNNLTSQIRRHGFSTVVKGHKTPDIRGRPKALVRRLAGLNSSKDPNSLARYGDGNVRDLLAASKGFSNESMFHNSYDDFMTRNRDKEHAVFKNIRGRFIDPGRSMETQINSNVLDNIMREVVVA